MFHFDLRGLRAFYESKLDHPRRQVRGAGEFQVGKENAAAPRILGLTPHVVSKRAIIREAVEEIAQEDFRAVFRGKAGKAIGAAARAVAASYPQNYERVKC
jgi:hypothetical protein